MLPSCFVHPSYPPLSRWCPPPAREDLPPACQSFKLSLSHAAGKYLHLNLSSSHLALLIKVARAKQFEQLSLAYEKPHLHMLHQCSPRKICLLSQPCCSHTHIQVKQQYWILPLPLICLPSLYLCSQQGQHPTGGGP